MPSWSEKTLSVVGVVLTLVVMLWAETIVRAVME